MNHLVKILQNDDGENIPEDEQCWHFVVEVAGGLSTLCTFEYFGIGESAAKFKEKCVKRGGITCSGCIEKIKMFKAVKL